MKRLHRPNLFGWSVFDEDRDIDFHSTVWVRPEGNVVIDPLPLSDHDEAHLRELGGAAWIVITNSDHVRDSVRLAEKTGAQLMGPLQEAKNFPLECTRWLTDGDEVVPGMHALLPCDGWPVFRDAKFLLQELLMKLDCREGLTD